MVAVQSITKKASIINSYPLGKSQRLIHAMHQYSSNISCHSSIEATNQSYRSIDVPIPTLIDIMDIPKRDAHKYLILTPTIISQAYWMQNFPGFEIAEASGWMATKIEDIKVVPIDSLLYQTMLIGML